MKLIRFTLLFAWVAAPLLAQRLPTGTYHPNRERSYDIVHYRAEIRLDWKGKRILGRSTIRLRPLLPSASVSLDAYWLSVSDVKELPAGTNLRFSSSETALEIPFGRTLQPNDTALLQITYVATPTAGLYFVDAPAGSAFRPTIFTYGEGGIHANWLPIYNDVNDKFTTEMIVTVEKPYEAISNGALISVKDNRDGTRTFHWNQKLPHSNYLIALFVGEYSAVPLRPAFGTIPVTAWVSPGQEEDAVNVFSRTADMIEFFSERFSFRYPWEKYDQVSAYDYAIGAMENTSITGHNDRIIRKRGQLEEFNPDFTAFTSTWTAETLVSHELAHHWFGNNLTCRNLSHIWLNESFASFSMMLWDEHRLGTEYYRTQTWLALQHYLKYVGTSRIIRPLEYRYFDSRGEIYNTETTYLKGAIVLNMLRWILGDDAFFRALGHYVNKHQFSNVESTDFKIAIEEATGKNLDWFFDQWVYGGGHPVFEVRSTYLPDRKKVELNVNQVQPMVEGQGLFRLPVEIRIDAGGRSTRAVIWVDGESTSFFFDVAGKPSMVSFDGRGALVCELLFEKDLDELLYQALNDELPGRFWAIHQLVKNHAAHPRTLALLRKVLNGQSHWFLRAESALQLQHLHSPEAEQLLLEQLTSSEYRVRKAAVIALGRHHTDDARAALRRVIESEPNDEVAATAVVSLSRIDRSLTPQYFRQLLRRTAWYDVMRIAVLTATENLGDAKFLPIVKEHASMKYNYAVRQQALTAWAACAPGDPQLVDALLPFVRNDILPVRITAIELLGKLKAERALPTLQEVAAKNGDGDIRKAARDAIEQVRKAGSQ